ncbi:MAG: Holliday junction resolvase RuvX [Enterobacteriaceae bacterium]
MYVISFDYGSKNIGVSLGNTKIKMSFPICTIKNKKNNLWNKIKKIFDTWNPSIVIIGIPKKHKNLKKNKIINSIKKFEQKIKKKFKNTKVKLHNEHLSTFEAKKISKKDDIDKFSAYLILKSYFNF